MLFNISTIILGPYAVQSVAESAVASPAPAVFAHNPTFVQGTASQGQVYYIATQNVAYQGAPQHGQGKNVSCPKVNYS